MALCKNCGAEIDGEKVICDTCAEKFSTPTAAAPAPAETCTCQEDPSKKTVGIFTYIGLFILLGIPVIGFICSIIFSFAPKAKSLKNFGRAALIWKVVSLLISVLVLTAMISILAPLMSEAVGFDLSVLQGIKVKDVTTVMELSEYIESDNYGAAIQMVKDGKLDDIIDRAKDGEFDEMIREFAGTEADEILNALHNGELDTEIEKIKRGEYDDMINGAIRNNAYVFAPAA